MGRAIDSHGWVAHFEYQSNLAPLVNYHTHGMPQALGHLDFQIVYPVAKKIAYDIMWALENEIRAGKQFEQGILYHNVVKGYPVMFVAAEEGKRPVLRLILPDQNGCFPGDDGCDPTYEAQCELLLPAY